MGKITNSTCITFAYTVFTVLMAVSYVMGNPEVHCEPRRQVVHLSNGSKQITPNSIEIYQCSGPFEDKQRCAAVNFHEFSMQVTTSSGTKEVTFRNHTKCAMKCSCHTNQGRVSYICNDTDKYDIACPYNQTWDYSLCRCTSVATDRNQLPGTGCGVKDNGEEDDSIPLSIFVLALVVELVVVLVVVFLVRDICKFNRRESGVLHKTAEFIRSVSNRPLERNMSLRKNRSDTGSESFLNTYSASTGKIDNV